MSSNLYQINQEEGFNMDQELALRSLLFSLIFYILATPQIVKILDQYLPRNIETLAVQAIVFGLLYYVISIWI